MGGNLMAKKEIVIPKYAPIVFEKSGAHVIEEINKRLATIHELLAQITAECKEK